MTHEEQACCRSMHGDCGEMAKSGCCQTEFHSDVHPQLAASAPHLQLAFLLGDWMACAFAPQSTSHLVLFRSPDEHSPPGLLITKKTVLRI